MTQHGGGGLDAHALIASTQPSAELCGVAQSLERVCRAALECLELSGAVVRILTGDGSASAVIAAEGTQDRLGEIEFDVGDGPGRTAHHLSRPVLVARLAGADGDQWPTFRDVAVDRGVAAVFVFPLHFGAVGFGTLELFAKQAGSLTPEQLQLCQALARIQLDLLLRGRPTKPDGSLSEGLAGVVDDHSVIAQAQGMAMVDLGVTLDDALSRLRAHAFAEGISLDQLAHDVLDGYQLPSDA